MKYLAALLAAVAVCAVAVAGETKEDVRVLSESPDTFDPSLNPLLIGGDVADPADWPASPWIGNCSSTLIGDKVLLTAAHCVSNGGAVRFTVGSQRYQARCSHHGEYRRNSTADWALCEVSSPVSGVKFERLAGPAQVECSVGREFLWTGYGCTRWGGRLDGKFRTGSVGTIRCPSGRNYDTVTRGNVALCSGDSGGGGYTTDGDGGRYLVGVNSRSDTRVTSYVSSTYVQTFLSWADEWAQSKGVQVCGLHSRAENCRGSEDPDPDPDPDPEPPKCEQERVALAEAVEALGQAHSSAEACLSGS